MTMIYVYASVWLLCAFLLIPLALHAAWRFSRPMTTEEISEARWKSEHDICYDCGGPLPSDRAHKRLFDRCWNCNGTV